MLMLILGVSLWSLAHLFKRLMPAMRERMGDVGKLVVTLVLIGSIVLMIAGYPQATGSVWWVRQPLWVSVNNLLVLLAVYLMVSSTMKTRVTGLIRHPQLTAVKAWCVAHLLVNGDAASLVLFGGLLAWAVVSVILINRQDGKAAIRQSSAGWGAELVGILVTVALYGAIAYAHGYLGYPVHG